MSCHRRRFFRQSGSKRPSSSRLGADVDLVVDAVRLLLLEVVREHRLRGLLLEVEVRRDALGDAGHALLEQPAPVGTRCRSARRARRDRPRSARARRGRTSPRWSNRLSTCARRNAMIPTSSPELRLALDLGDALVDAVAAARRSAGQRPRLAAQPDHVARRAGAGSSRSAWMARLRCVDEPRMSASAVERVDPLEHDRLHLGDRVGGALGLAARWR